MIAFENIFVSSSKTDRSKLFASKCIIPMQCNIMHKKFVPVEGLVNEKLS